MTDHMLNRREWIGVTAGALSLTAGRRMRRAGGAEAKRPRVAAVVTEFTHRSHAHVILENFLEPYYFNGKLTDSGMDVVSLYVDQFPADRDMARAQEPNSNGPLIPPDGPLEYPARACELRVRGHWDGRLAVSNLLRAASCCVML